MFGINKTAGCKLTLCIRLLGGTEGQRSKRGERLRLVCPIALIKGADTNMRNAEKIGRKNCY
jgi:hypothetical protein